MNKNPSIIKVKARGPTEVNNVKNKPALPPLRESSEFVDVPPLVTTTMTPIIDAPPPLATTSIRKVGGVGICDWLLPDDIKCAHPQLPVEYCQHIGCTRPVHHLCQNMCEEANNYELEGGKKRCPNHHPMFSIVTTSNAQPPAVGGAVFASASNNDSPISDVTYTRRLEPSPAKSTELMCCAKEYCCDADDVSALADIDLSSICINCNYTCHNACATSIFLQTPNKAGTVDYDQYLCSAGKQRLQNFKGVREDVKMCRSCKVDIDNRLSLVKKPPTKKIVDTKIVTGVLKELKDAATLQALAFVFKKDRMSTKEKEQCMYNEFHGDNTKKGTARQLIDGDGVFSQLYDLFEGEEGEERVLKDSFCFNSSCRFVVGRHITLDLITLFSDGTKRHSGKTLLKNGALLLRNLKKSLTVVEALSPHIVQVHSQTLRVLSFSSGQNMSSFMRKVNDGMYAVRDDENFVRSKNKQAGDEGNADKDAAEWDPFGGVEAQENWKFNGYIAFRIMGPAAGFGTIDATSYYCPLLQQAVEEQSREQRKQMSRDALRKETESNNVTARNNAKGQQMHNVLSLQTQCDIATIALGRAEADQRVHDRNLLNMSKQIEMKKLDIELVLGLLNGCTDPEESKSLRAELYKLRGDIGTMEGELKSLRMQPTAKNEIVDNLLENATAALKKKQGVWKTLRSCERPEKMMQTP